ncbi:cytidine deaminase [Mycoplasmatota bacterium]|nr:cytidine deaminase [Mycoplasmatota bacterium]
MKSLEEAKKARINAYTPYSKFKVGAAIELNDGTYIHGANIENAALGLCNCAERSALFSLYSQGYKKQDIKSMTIVADTHDPVSPCGACRQVMSELLPKETKIILANLDGATKTVTKDELLPYAFETYDEE